MFFFVKFISPINQNLKYVYLFICKVIDLAEIDVHSIMLLDEMVFDSIINLLKQNAKEGHNKREVHFY